MKRLVLVMLGALAVLLVLGGCEEAAPNQPTAAANAKPTAPKTSVLKPVAPNTDEPVAQATEPAAPTEEVTPAETSPFFQHAQELLNAYKPPETDPAPLHDAIAQGAIQLLQKLASPDQMLEEQTALDDLLTALDQMQVPDEVTPNLAVIHVRDSEGGSEDVLIISFDQLKGLPLVAIHRLGSSYQVIQMEGPSALSGLSGVEARNYSSSIAGGDDVTGDSVGEATFTYQIPGGSGDTTEVHVDRWEPDAKKFKPIFQATLVNWDGEATYEFVPTDTSQDIQLTYPWFGVFDHKLADHASASQVWTYDAKQDRFVKKSEEVDQPSTVRQQLNVAEGLFRRGEYEKALTEYENAWKDQSLTEEDYGDHKTAARGFARFRQGELFALLGRSSQAQSAFGDAKKSGGDLAKLVDAFAKNNSGEDGSIRAWASLSSAMDVDAAIYGGKSDLDLPAAASEILYPGFAVAAYLDAHQDAGADVFNKVAALGLKTSSSTVVDLDGDGQNEYLFVTESGGGSPNKLQHLWLVYKSSTTPHWLARDILQEPTVSLDGASVALKEGKGKAVKIKLPSNVQPSEQVFTWDRTRVIYLDPQSLKPRETPSPWPVVGGENSNSQF